MKLTSLSNYKNRSRLALFGIAMGATASVSVSVSADDNYEKFAACFASCVSSGGGSCYHKCDKKYPDTDDSGENEQQTTISPPVCEGK